MEILLNGQHISFELKDEKDLKSLIDSILMWSKERDLIFTDFIVDDIYCTIDGYENIPLDGISIIDCNIQSISDVIFSSLSEAILYCDRILLYINDSITRKHFDVGEITPFYEGIQWLKEITIKVFSLLELNPNDIKHMDKAVSDYLEDISRLAEELKGKTSEAEIINFLNEQKNLFELYKGIYKMVMLSDNLRKIIIRSVDSPAHIINSLKTIKSDIELHKKNLEDAAQDYQTGKDAEGSEKLHKFIDFIYLYIRTTYQASPVFLIDPETVAVDDISLTDKNNDITNMLSQIIEVMENSDIVGLSDILEYEIKPALDNMPAYIDIILSKAV